MITVGIDSGSQHTEAIVLREKTILGCARVPSSFDAHRAAVAALETAVEAAHIQREQVEFIAVTGVGRNMIPFADGLLNEVISAAMGVSHIQTGVGLIIGMGAEASRAIRLHANGAVRDYELNDKCAAGGGTFLETMARVLQVSMEEMGQRSLNYTKMIPMNAQCVVFAESEVISLIHQNESVENIAHALNAGVCGRICSMIRRLGRIEGSTVLIGGPGHNAGFVSCMEQELGCKVLVPENTDYISALGAACWAGTQTSQQKSEEA